MFIVADSGATKTDWVVVDDLNNIVREFSTEGINPMIQTESYINNMLKEQIAEEDQEEKYLGIFFFGAGCSTPEKVKIVHGALKSVFTETPVHVEHDLAGAVYALCGKEPGFACILGTGSNAVFFDGIQQQKINPSLGYVMGDEGSGAYIGKMLARDFLYKLLPPKMDQYFKEEVRLDKDIIIENVYQKPNPNRYLASLTKHLGLFKGEKYTSDLLQKAFTDFLNYQVLIYPHHRDFPIHFLGSVAYYYSDELIQVCEKMNLKVGKIMVKPIYSIASYIHKRQYIENN